MVLSSGLSRQGGCHVKPKSGVWGWDAEIANRSRLLGYDIECSDIVPPAAQVADSCIQEDSAYTCGVKQDRRTGEMGN